MSAAMFRRYSGITLGCIICSVTLNLFFVPVHLLSGGLSGIAMMLYYLFELPIGAQLLIYNLPLFYIAYRKMSRQFVIDTIFGTVVWSFAIDATQFLSVHAPVNDTMLAAIFGGVFHGVGMGLIFRMNGTGGGLDIVAAIVKKYYSLNMGGFIFSLNCVIMAFAAMFFGVMPAMYTLISMYISGRVTDNVVGGFEHRKVLFIISDYPERIAEAIIHEVGRGVTFLDGEGAFTHQSRRVVMVVASLTQIARLKNITHSFDPRAFMIVLDAGEVMGKGFTMPVAEVEAILEQRENKEAEKP